MAAENFYADPFSGRPWEIAQTILDDTFLRLRTVLADATFALIVVRDEGLIVAQRGTLDFRGELVTVSDDPLSDMILVTLPNYGAPVDLGNATIDGSHTAVSAFNHVHKRDVRVQQAGADIGTRNKLNFDSTFTVVDNPGADSVDVSGGGSGSGLVPLTGVLMGEPVFVWDADLNLVMAEGG